MDKAFYLKCSKNPKTWYERSPIGYHTLNNIVKEIASEGGLVGYYTNNSLRVTTVTRLFQHGVDTRIIQDQTGHRSDAVTRYKRTNEIQLQNVSKILQCSEIKVTKLESTTPSDRKPADCALIKDNTDSTNEVQNVVIDDQNNPQKRTLNPKDSI